MTDKRTAQLGSNFFDDNESEKNTNEELKNLRNKSEKTHNEQSAEKIRLKQLFCLIYNYLANFGVVSWFHGFKTEFIYGIVSCSGLFIFIEILSGWYLKQYRQCVDTSTYLLKIKAIFDKFMLAYLFQKSLSDRDVPGKKLANKTLLIMLRKEISWPNAYILKRADANFAVEAVEALSKINKSLTKKDKEHKSY